jgi:hypothetical protein
MSRKSRYRMMHGRARSAYGETAGSEFKTRNNRPVPPKIRTAERSVWHPFGRALLCAHPPCPFLARAGFEIMDERGVLWPFCSRDHQMQGIPS